MTTSGHTCDELIPREASGKCSRSGLMQSSATGKRSSDRFFATSGHALRTLFLAHTQHFEHWRHYVLRPQRRVSVP